MKGLKVKSSTWFRLILFPLLLPFSIVYGFAALIKKKLSAVNQISLGFPVFSVGNFTVGGTGKTPLVILLVQDLLDLGKEPVLISKSYKGSLKVPTEVQLESDLRTVGDEALLLKKTFPIVRVFSGPHKTKTALFAASKIVDPLNVVFVMDDAAQHHGLYKDFRIHMWDMSLHKVDIFPFPLGRAREFWFFGEPPSLTILNRSKSSNVKSNLETPRVLRAQFKVKSVLNSQGQELSEDFVLISGLGNFDQLESSVRGYIKSKDFEMLKTIEGRDHDKFDWFQPEPGLNYVCTRKDLDKLKNKLSEGKLYIVESEFSDIFKDDFLKVIKNFFKKRDG